MPAPTLPTLNVGGVALAAPVILAPMSGVTDLPFRRLVRSFGAGLVVSEMIASEAMVRAARQSLKMATGVAEEFPMAVQLAGADPAMMAEAARLNEARGAAIIDINFGCPVKKVVNKMCGSALMRDEALAGRIVEAVVRAVSVPVTVKMRTGWDEASRNAPALARISEAAGARMITVHGRTRCQLYRGHADWHFIREVQEAVRVPVVANGDIASAEDARACLAASGADGVMIGRGAYGRPWLPAQIGAHLIGGEVPSTPSVAVRHRIVRRHYDDMLGHYGIRTGVPIARKHLAWYSNGMPGSAEFRRKINAMNDPADVMDEIDLLFADTGEPQALAA